MRTKNSIYEWELRYSPVYCAVLTKDAFGFEPLLASSFTYFVGSLKQLCFDEELTKRQPNSEAQITYKL